MAAAAAAVEAAASAVAAAVAPAVTARAAVTSRPAVRNKQPQRIDLHPSQLVLQKERRQLLNSAISGAQSLDRAEAELLRSRMFGAGQRRYAPMPTSELAEIVGRPVRVRSPDRMGQGLGSSPFDTTSAAARRVAEAKEAKQAKQQEEAGGEISPRSRGRVHLPSVDRRRTREVQNGKSVLEANCASFRPLFREKKQMEFDGGEPSSRSQGAAADGAATPGASVGVGAAAALTVLTGGARGATEEAGGAGGSKDSDDDEADEDAGTGGGFALDLMMMLDSDSLPRLKHQFAKFGNEVGLEEFVSPLCIQPETRVRGVRPRAVIPPDRVVNEWFPMATFLWRLSCGGFLWWFPMVWVVNEWFPMAAFLWRLSYRGFLWCGS